MEENYEFKIGDKVRCKPGFTIEEESGGYAYKENLEGTIKKIINDLNPCAFFKEFPCGIYLRALELVTEENNSIIPLDQMVDGEIYYYNDNETSYIYKYFQNSTNNQTTCRYYIYKQKYFGNVSDYCTIRTTFKDCTIKLATQEQKDWLNACIEKGKLVHEEDVISKKERKFKCIEKSVIGEEHGILGEIYTLDEIDGYEIYFKESGIHGILERFQEVFDEEQVSSKPEELDPMSHNFKVGDRVKVLRKAKNFEKGWGDRWDSSMDDVVNTIIKIEKTHKEYGLLDGNSNCWFPPFVLEKVEGPIFKDETIVGDLSYPPHPQSIGRTFKDSEKEVEIIEIVKRRKKRSLNLSLIKEENINI